MSKKDKVIKKLQEQEKLILTLILHFEDNLSLRKHKVVYQGMQKILANNKTIQKEIAE